MRFSAIALKSLLVGAFVLLTLGTAPSRAFPLPTAQSLAGKAGTENNLIKKVHGYHCRSDYGRVVHRHGRGWHEHRRWHRHRGACYRRYGYGAPVVYYGYRRYYRPRYWRPRHYRRRYRHPVYVRRYVGPRFNAGPRRFYSRGIVVRGGNRRAYRSHGFRGRAIRGGGALRGRGYGGRGFRR